MVKRSRSPYRLVPHNVSGLIFYFYFFITGTYYVALALGDPTIHAPLRAQSGLYRVALEARDPLVTEPFRWDFSTLDADLSAGTRHILP